MEAKNMSKAQKALLGALATAGICALTWNVLAQSGQRDSRRNMAEGPPAAIKVQPASLPAHDVREDAAPGQLTVVNNEGKPAGLCPLKHTDVQADISGFVARVNVKQEFQNTSTTPVEAVYTFPLPDDAAVDNMTMTIGNRVIKSEIKKREEAQEIYETAKNNGQAAALLDQERPNIFTQSVANVMPGDNVTIAISYVHLLKYQEGEYEFHFPMVVGKRYIGGDGAIAPTDIQAEQKGQVQSHTGAIIKDAEKITPPTMPVGIRAGHNISLTVHLNAGLPIAAMNSVLHEIDVKDTRLESEIPSEIRTITLKDKDTIPNQDFILKYKVAGPEIQAGVLTHADAGKGGYFTAIVQPPNAPIQGDITPKEMVFVIDQTGSQGGWPIEKAKETMRYCIENLNPGDTFQLIGFNTELFPCFPKPVPATQETVAKALAFLKPLEGNGGTDILKSVDYALKLPDDPNRLRIVCYMTDGFVGNDMQIIDSIQKNRGRARMFPFGVGNSVNRFLIDNMAVEGKGAAEYVTLQDDGKAAAARFNRRIAKPLLMNITVDWNGLPVADVYPQQIPDLFTAGPIILKGRYTQPASGDIIIHGLLRGQPWSQRVHVDLPAQGADGSQIATLWARERIEDLQRQDWLGAQKGTPNPAIQQNIVATALEYRLMSQYTSFVAVEQRVINQGGRSVRIDVPVESAKGAFGDGFAQDKEANLALHQRLGRSNVSRNYSNSLSAGLPALAAPSGIARAKAPAKSSPAQKLSEAKKPSAATATLGASLADKDSADEALRDVSPPSKLHALLTGLAARVKKEGKDGSLTVPGKLEVKDQKVEVQISLEKLPKDGLEQLKALGLTDATVLTADKLLLGWVPVANLEKIAALTFVTRISPPLYTK